MEQVVFCSGKRLPAPLADLLDGLQEISNRYVSFAVNVAHSVSEIYGG